MEDLERVGSLSDVLKAAIQAELRSMPTALPAIVSKSGQHTASLHSAVHGLVRHADGTVKQAPMPEFQTVPVHFAGGGRVVATHPVKEGDEGILQFASRALDSWHQSSGRQNVIDSRTHDWSDAFYIPGVKSDPNQIKNPAPDSHQVRSLDGKVTTDHHPDNGVTTKVVDPADAASNPFVAATTFHSTTHSPAGGIVQTATDGNNLHTATLEKAAGYAVSIASSIASHSMSVSPSGGMVTSVRSVTTGQQHSLFINPNGGFTMASTKPINLSAPGLSLPTSSVAASALAGGAASSNIGGLGGFLTGTLPIPSYNMLFNWLSLSLASYSNNVAARAAGVPAGRLYLSSAVSGEYLLAVAH